MPSPRFTAESTSNGVIERDFVVGEVPGVLWSPALATGRAPLVLMGHVPLDALVAKFGGNRNAIYKALFDARRKVREALVAEGYLDEGEVS